MLGLLAAVGFARAGVAGVAVRGDGLWALSDVVLLLAAVASLAGVGDVMMLGAARNDPISPGVAISLAVTTDVIAGLAK